MLYNCLNYHHTWFHFLANDLLQFQFMIISLNKASLLHIQKYRKAPFERKQSYTIQFRISTFWIFPFYLFLKGERNCLKNVEGRRGDVVKIDDDGVWTDWQSKQFWHLTWKKKTCFENRDKVDKLASELSWKICFVLNNLWAHNEGGNFWVRHSWSDLKRHGYAILILTILPN